MKNQTQTITYSDWIGYYNTYVKALNEAEASGKCASDSYIYIDWLLDSAGFVSTSIAEAFTMEFICENTHPDAFYWLMRDDVDEQDKLRIILVWIDEYADIDRLIPLSNDFDFSRIVDFKQAGV